jgi:WD40 repeat protein
LFAAGVLIFACLSADRALHTEGRAAAAVPRPELVLQTGHTESVTRVAFGPDGNWIATAGTDALIKIWETGTGRELRTFYGHTASVRALGRSNDGRLLASGSNDRTVRVWEVGTGKTMWRFETGRSSVTAVAISSDSSRLAAVGFEGLLKIWDLTSGLPVKDLSSAGVNFTAAVFAPDGRSIFAAGSDSTIKAWNIADGKNTNVYRTGGAPVTAIAVSPDGSAMAAGGTDKKVMVWRTGDPKGSLTFSGHEEAILDLAFVSADEIISVDALQVLRTWSATSGADTKPKVAAPSDGFTRAQSAAVTRSGDLLIFGLGKGATLVDGRSGAAIRSLEGKTGGYGSVAISTDGRWLAGGSRDFTIKLWDLRSGESLDPLVGHEGYVRAVAFHPDGTKLFSAGIDGSIRVWNLHSGGASVRIEANKGGVNALAVSRSGSRLASAGVDGVVRIWDAVSLAELAPLRGHTGEVNGVGLSPDGSIAISAGADGTVRFWDVASATQTSVLNNGAPVTSIAFSSDGKRVVFGSQDGSLKTADAAFATIIRDSPGNQQKVWGVAFSPSGESVVAGGQDRTARAWRLNGPGPAAASIEHRGAVTSVAFAPDGKWFATASEDGSVSLWNAETQAPLATLVSMSGNGEWLVVAPQGYFDGSPEAWRQLLWRFSGSTFDISSVEVFFFEFYQPGLLADLIQGRGLPDRLDIASKDRRQPRVSIAASSVGPSDRTAKIRIRVTDPSGPGGSGAKDVRLFRNGSLIYSWDRDVLAGTNGEVTLEYNAPIVYGQNEFTAYAFNRDNVKSSDDTLIVTGPESLRREGVTYVFGIGVGEYQNPDFNLSFIDSDVNEFTETIRRKQFEMDPRREVRTIQLLNAEATKAKIIGTIRSAVGDAANARTAGAQGALAGLRPEDTLIVYFSGHGFNDGKRFYMIPYDIGTAASRADLTKVTGSSISDQELQEAFRGVDARNIVLIIDACNSGKALEAEDKRMGPMNNKGLAQFAYEKGMFVLTASQPEESAYVSAERKRSYLAYALVEEGLKRSLADTSPADGQIYLREWFDYASRRVPEMRNEAIAKAKKAEEESKGLKEVRVAPGVQRPRVFYRRQRSRNEMVVAVAKAS